jgi:hypothetical protein
MPDFLDADNFLVLDVSKQNICIDENIWTGIVSFEQPVEWGTWSIFKSGISTKKALEKIKQIYRNYKIVSIFLSDIQWRLNNAIFGMIAGNKNKKQIIKICNFPDGVGALICPEPKNVMVAYNFIRKISGALKGVPYRLYMGDHIGHDYVEKIYSLFPPILPDRKSKIVKIPTNLHLVKKVDSDACIFLGQDYKNCMEKKEYISFQQSTVMFLKKLGYPKLYYKPHHFESWMDDIVFYSQNGFSLITTKKPMEEYYLENPVACVVSYNCSALPQLKILFNNAVRCIAYHGLRILKYGYYKRVKDSAKDKTINLYKMTGVELHE